MPSTNAPQGRSVKRNFSSSLVGQGAYAATQFAMLSILGHTTNPTTVGFYALALAIMAPVFTLCEMRLRLIAATDANKRFRFGSLLSHRLSVAFLPVGGVALIVIVGHSYSVNLPILLAVTAYKAVESILDITYGEMARAERLDLSAKSMLLRSAGNLVLFALIIVPTQRVDLAYWLLTVYNVLCLAVSLKDVKSLGNMIRPKWVSRDFLALSKLGLPLGLAFAIGSFGVNTPRYFIQWNLGTTSVAVYSTAAYVLVAITTLINALAQASTPRLARYFTDGKITSFRKLLARTLLLGGFTGSLGIIGAWIFGKQFLLIAFGRDYVSGATPLLVLMIAAAAQYGVTFMREAFAAMRHYKIVLPISLANALTVVITCAWLVPTLGVTGAAMAVLLGQTLALTLYASLFYCRGRAILESRYRE